MTKIIHGADLFCGAGGTTTGLLQAAAALGRRVEMLAVNHWNIAIDTHTRNHPGVRHLCESLDNVDPRKAIPGGKLSILCASPECTHHSIARGGKPCSDQSRATAWHICRWAEALHIETILIENVREFRNWGPLGRAGQPLKRYKGKTYQAFLGALRSLGYEVEDRVLNAADFGDATTRQRLFIMARRRGAITWPDATHIGKWKPAREIIDWELQGQSIFGRKRPLSETTMRRIGAGLRKFGGEAFIVKFHGEFANRKNIDRVYSPEQPLPTIDCSNRMGIAEPFIVQTDQTGSNGACVRGVDEPIFTAPTKQNMALVEPFLVNFKGTSRAHIDASAKSCKEPLRTITSYGRPGLVQPFLVKYNSTGGPHPVTDPLDTISTRDRFGLVEGKEAGARLDIHFRMLQPHELAAAMSFPADYEFTGTRENKVRQIGNAVPVRTAAALCEALLRE